MRPGPRNALTDVAGLSVGQAEDAELKSGVTVVRADTPATCGVHVMGGAPGTRETDLLAPDKTVQAVDAVVLSGGSAFGLDAAAGVMDALAAEGRGYAVGPARVPIVPAAILFDLLNGGDKDWVVNPYRALGAAALAAAGPEIAEGSVGAGTGAFTAGLKGGIGTASLVLPSGVTVAALVAVNAFGSVTGDADGRFWAAPFEIDGEFGGRGQAAPGEPVDTFRTKQGALAEGNTTIAVVASDATLTKAGCTRLATAAHDGLARAIVPAHTPGDGDLVFALATGQEPDLPEIEALLLGHGAALCLSRAIARAVYRASAAPGDPSPTWEKRFGSTR
ncbi:MAG: P1 family peptidase [Pseudomonadota bacterium]